MTFIVLISTRLTSSNSLSDSGSEVAVILCVTFLQFKRSSLQSPEMEKCLGFTSLGKNVSLERERAHWFSVITSPRKVFTGTFKLE